MRIMHDPRQEQAMFEQEIVALTARERVNLDRLESDIWHRERHIAALRAAGRFLASSQGAVLVIAVVLSAAIGAAIASRGVDPRFMVEENLAPSHLLLGDKP
jgi:hypothetical protein